MTRDDEYLATKVMTASPHQLHLMVVDGAIRHARQGIAALEAEHIEAAHDALSKCRDFVGELIGGLDRSVAPAIVDQMQSLFLFIYRCLVDADLRRDVQLVRDAVKILELHRTTWVALADVLKDKGPKAETKTVENASRGWTT